MKHRWHKVFTGVLIGALLFADAQPKPLLLIVIVDPTISAHKERAQWIQQFEVLVSSYLPTPTQVAFVKAERYPAVQHSLAYDGSRSSAQKIAEAFKKALEPTPCSHSPDGRPLYSGTDVTGAIREAVSFALKPENAAFQRKLIIGWSDLIPDPSKCPNESQSYDPPTKYIPPEGARTVELVLHGIDDEKGRVMEKIELLRKHWQGRFKSLKLYHWGEQVQIEDHYGLTRKQRSIF